MSSQNSKRSIFSIMLMAGAIMTHTGPAQASETTLQRIEREGVLHAATEPEFEPFEFLQDGKIVGYGTDILHEVAQRMGVKLDQQGMPFNAILPSLIAHKVDLAATTLAATPERRAKVDFTAPIGELPLVIVTRADNQDIHTRDDFKGHTVGVQQSSSVDSEFKKWDEALKQQGIGMRAINRYQSFPETMLALQNKQIEATALPLPMAANWIKKTPDTFKIVGWWNYVGDTDSTAISWAVRKGDSELKAKIDHLLIDMANDGTLDALQIKWFGKSLNEWKVVKFNH